MTEPIEIPADDDFLAFWEQHRAQKQAPTVSILGVAVPIPNDLPLSFEQEAKALENSQKQEDIEHLLGLLFPANVLAHWTQNGLTHQQLQVILAWGIANGSGKKTSFGEAAEIVERAEQLKAADAGKAPNPAARRASSKTGASGTTGRSSKATSRASTGSTRKN